MAEFVDAVLGMPTLLFGILLVAVVGYWLLVLVGVVELDEGGTDGGAGGLSGLLSGMGLAGPPLTVVASLLVAFAWFISLCVSVLLGRAGVGTGLLAGLGILVVAALLAGVLTRLLVVPLRRLFPDVPAPSHVDFVGALCVIRTGTVTVDFGQAEVTAADGSSAIIQVRQTGGDAFAAGDTAVLYDYDAEGGFFWVVPTAATPPGSGPGP
jgi:hypothetical protein